MQRHRSPLVRAILGFELDNEISESIQDGAEPEVGLAWLSCNKGKGRFNTIVRLSLIGVNLIELDAAVALLIFRKPPLTS